MALQQRKPLNYYEQYHADAREDEEAEAAARRIVDEQARSVEGLRARAGSDQAWNRFFDSHEVKRVKAQMRGTPAPRIGLGGIGLGTSTKQGGQTIARSGGGGGDDMAPRRPSLQAYDDVPNAAMERDFNLAKLRSMENANRAQEQKMRYEDESRNPYWAKQYGDVNRAEYGRDVQAQSDADARAYLSDPQRTKRREGLWHTEDVQKVTGPYSPAAIRAQTEYDKQREITRRNLDVANITGGSREAIAALESVRPRGGRASGDGHGRRPGPTRPSRQRRHQHARPRQQGHAHDGGHQRTRPERRAHAGRRSTHLREPWLRGHTVNVPGRRLRSRSGTPPTEAEARDDRRRRFLRHVTRSHARSRKRARRASALGSVRTGPRPLSPHRNPSTTATRSKSLPTTARSPKTSASASLATSARRCFARWKTNRRAAKHRPHSTISTSTEPKRSRRSVGRSSRNCARQRHPRACYRSPPNPPRAHWA